MLSFRQTSRSPLDSAGSRVGRGDRKNEIAGRGGVVCTISLLIKTSIFYKSFLELRKP